MKRMRVLGWWFSWAALGWAALTAQELKWSEPQWLSVDDEPDTRPRIRKIETMRPTAPMTEYPAPAYAELRVFVPARGEAVMFDLESTVPWLSYELANDVRSATIEPARREGQAVASEVVLHLIFNPASAAEKGPTADARLLRVVPPGYPSAEKEHPRRPRLTHARVRVGTAGEVLAVEPEDPLESFRQAAVVAVQQWTFAPARDGGSPVESWLRVPVLFVPERSDEKGRTPPTVVSQARPIYPMGLRLAGAGGHVLVSFVVTVEGRVSEAFIVRSTNAGFDDAALTAVRSWRFRPGIVEGRPVNTRMQVPLTFAIEGEKLFLIKRPKAFPADLPEHLRYDVPPELTDLVLPTYPVEALEAKHEGKVRVAFVIGPDGRVHQSKLMGTPPAPELGLAAQAAVESFRFKPAAKDGLPSTCLLSIELEFDRSGLSGHVPVSNDMRRALRLLQKRDQLAKAQDLDATPKPAALVEPLRPTSLPRGVPAEAVVEFVIDRSGLARLPRVITATHPEVGAAAALAISQWRYEPARRAGKPVDVLVRVPVVFGR